MLAAVVWPPGGAGGPSAVPERPRRAGQGSSRLDRAPAAALRWLVAVWIPLESGRLQRVEPSGPEQPPGQLQQPGQDIGAALGADPQAPVGQQPGQRPLELPAVAAQPPDWTPRRGKRQHPGALRGRSAPAYGSGGSWRQRSRQGQSEQLKRRWRWTPRRRHADGRQPGQPPGKATTSRWSSPCTRRTVCTAPPPSARPTADAKPFATTSSRPSRTSSGSTTYASAPRSSRATGPVWSTGRDSWTSRAGR